MAVEANGMSEEHEPAPEVRSARGRKVLRLFLIAAGGLAAPCLALAAFFLANGDDGGGRPAAKSGLVQSGQVTPQTRRAAPAAAVTTTTTPPSSPVGPPARDPFRPLVTQAPAGEAPAR